MGFFRFQEFSYPRDHLIPGYSDTIGGGLTSESELNLRSSRKFGEPSDSFYEGKSCACTLACAISPFLSVAFKNTENKSMKLLSNRMTAILIVA